jgi:hypothetical protein
VSRRRRAQEGGVRYLIVSGESDSSERALRKIWEAPIAVLATLMLRYLVLLLKSEWSFPVKITEISAQNFRALKTIRLSNTKSVNGVNVIVGPNAIGK